MTRIPEPDNEHRPIAGAAGTMPAAVPDSHDDRRMTDKQAVVLRELCDRHGEPFDGNLTVHQAKERIEFLRNKD